MDFREYTPAELAAELVRLGADMDVVDVELQGPAGEQLAEAALQLHVGYEDDYDRSGGYRWVRITARLER